MVESSFFLATKEVAIRGGDIANRYRAADGRFIVSNRYLKRIVLTASEYITGLKGVTPITEQEANALIAANGYKKGTIS